MRLSILLATLALTACASSTTATIRGSIPASGETFAGTLTGDRNRSGTLQVKSSKGATCQGSFLFTLGREGKGVLTCDDGRSGPFEFASSSERGVGSGDLNGERYTFTLGN